MIDLIALDIVIQNKKKIYRVAMIKLIIFDLDGTLIDAYGAIARSINYTLSKLNYSKISYARTRKNVGLGDRNFIARFVKPGDVEEALALYRSHHQESLLEYSKVKPYAKKVLATLKKEGIKLAVASNRTTKFSHVLISHLALEKYFDVIACADKKHELKPEPYLLLKIIKKLRVTKEEVLYVGDMCFDVQAGHNARVRAVAVLGGSDSKSELAKCKPYKIISNLAQLISLWRRT